MATRHMGQSREFAAMWRSRQDLQNKWPPGHCTGVPVAATAAGGGGGGEEEEEEEEEEVERETHARGNVQKRGLGSPLPITYHPAARLC